MLSSAASNAQTAVTSALSADAEAGVGLAIRKSPQGCAVCSRDCSVTHNGQRVTDGNGHQRTGIVVDAVAPNGPAANRLQKGDLITHIGMCSRRRRDAFALYLSSLP